MIALTANGSFASAYQAIDTSEIVSSRQLTKEEFTAKLSKAKVVIHNASSLNCPDLYTAVQNNFEFTKHLVDILQSTNPDVHLVFLSSMSILDSMNENKYADVLAMSPYAYSKYLAETYCLKSDLRYLSCVRFSTLFYKDPRKDGLSKLISDATLNKKISLINKGEAARDFLPLNVAVNYIKKIVSQKPDGHRVYTLASGEPRRFEQIANILKAQLPDLEIDTVRQEDTPRILSEFQTHDIDELGRIPFDLEAEITDFIKELGT